MNNKDIFTIAACSSHVLILRGERTFFIWFISSYERERGNKSTVVCQRTLSRPQILVFFIDYDKEVRELRH